MNELKHSAKKVRKLEPFMKYIDGTEMPFGEKRQGDGIYTLNYHTTMNGEDGGYDVDAVFGVWAERKLDDEYTIYDEHIFVGECPHKDENTRKYYLWYNHRFNKIQSDYVYRQSMGDIHFKSRELAHKAIEILGEETVKTALGAYKNC